MQNYTPKTREQFEVWRQIKDFSDYDVSNLGNIANNKTDVILEKSLTKQGGVKVGLVKNGKQYTRSVKVLVANTFVEGKTNIFNTPILLNGDQLDCSADNIMWRPRWHAWHYSYQFNNVKDFYRIGPVLELDDNGIIFCAYKDVVEAGIVNGVLFSDIWKSIHMKRKVFPTGQNFTLHDKV
jgi:hypothetical protein